MKTIAVSQGVYIRCYGYLYPVSMFVPIELPEIAEKVLMANGKNGGRNLIR